MTIFGSQHSTTAEHSAFHAACQRIAERYAPYPCPVKLWLKAFVLRQSETPRLPYILRESATERVTVWPPKLRGVNRR